VKYCIICVAWSFLASGEILHHLFGLISPSKW
jgi:hypothetical protein